MVVTTQKDGVDSFGLCVGAENARRYFPRTASTVELHLGDLHIQCRLPDGFWNGQAEIHDPRLCEWLKFKVVQQRRNQSPVALRMVQSGANTFTLHPAALIQKRSARMVSTV